jgi:hypothetical protein
VIGMVEGAVRLTGGDAGAAGGAVLGESGAGGWGFWIAQGLPGHPDAGLGLLGGGDDGRLGGSVGGVVLETERQVHRGPPVGVCCLWYDEELFLNIPPISMMAGGKEN